MTVSLNILIVEDHPGLVANMYDFFEARGHRLDAAANGVLALNLLGSHTYDVVVVDWMMPRLNGIGLVEKMRVGLGLETPVIMVTAKSTLEDKIEGFHAGVDDYLVKPFELAELELRCLALSHRKPRRQRVLVVDDLRYDLDTLGCWRGDRPVSLFPVTRTLLTLLMQESPRVVSRDRLIEAVWNDVPPKTDLLRRHIHELRRQLVQGAEAALLHSVTGVGYVLRKAEGT
jgi:DNA-binding response OmpR family regulator